MALLNPTTSNYLKVKNVNIMYDYNNQSCNVSIVSELYASSEKRWSGMTSFEKSEIIVSNLVNFSFTDDTIVNFKDKLITNAYISLKIYGGFGSWTDC